MLHHPRILLISITAGVMMLGLIAAAQAVPWAQLGDAYRAREGDGAIVARVNGLPITEGELRISVAAAELNNSLSPVKVATDRRSALGRLFESRALAAEAARRSIAPSPTEVNAYIAQVRQGFAVGATAGAHLSEFLGGTGQTADEFFSSPAVRSRYAVDLAVAQLRASVVRGLSPDSANSAWQALVTQIRQSMSVEILDPTLR